MLLATGAVDLIGSSGVLGFVLGGGLLTALIGAYRFLVNFRMTERGLARDRVDQAVRGEQAERKRAQRAERESSLWQSRCGDLEYAMRRAGVPVPPISAELHVLAYSGNATMADDEPPRRRRRARPEGPEPGLPSIAVMGDRLRREQLDQADIAAAREDPDGTDDEER